MKAKELREKSLAELQKELGELRKEQFNLRMQKNAGETPKAHVYKNARRNIARIGTVLREKKE